ncbi:unnamed protein product [Linum trigynum]|uniref:Uncharacterized protein n=1 Tax=Linum trigynum TaxID=586398 RepID=A0AAV2FF49_9ROSI
MDMPLSQLSLHLAAVFPVSPLTASHRSSLIQRRRPCSLLRVNRSIQQRRPCSLVCVNYGFTITIVLRRDLSISLQESKWQLSGDERNYALGNWICNGERWWETNKRMRWEHINLQRR